MVPAQIPRQVSIAAVKAFPEFKGVPSKISGKKELVAPI